ncbi:MAG: glycosyltransferase family 2 protein [Nanoarchaeota archaeon]|nr:glycosyltransferase family 2 protein [Nanoarchaeota archaeon]
MKKRLTDQEIKEFISKPVFDERILLSQDKSYHKISVVIPSLNQGKFLEKTILSILNQNYPNFELIIIDAGSKDGSLEIIKKYQKYVAYWLSEKDRGQSDGLNKGFSRATGDVVTEQDADDIYLPGAFYKINELFKKYPGMDVIYGNRLDIDKNDKIISERRYVPFSSIVLRYDGMMLGPQSAFWKRDLFSRIGMYDLKFHLAMDYDFFVRAALSETKFKHVSYYFSAMRRHEGSKTEIHLGKLPHQKECDEIDKRYGRKKWLNFPLKIYSLLYRTVWYFLQGDGDYVLNGIKRRIKNKSILSGR